MMKLPKLKTEEWLIFAAVTAATIFIFSRTSNKRKGKFNSTKTDKSKNYVIGDSQSPNVDWGSEKVKLIGFNQTKQGPAGEPKYLWQGGKNLEWLNNAVKEHPVSPDVNSIVICIGTNDGYNQNKDIAGLVNNIKTKFPNAKLYAVQGSWNWGDYYKKYPVTEQQVRAFYKKFSDLGVELIEPPIGPIEPHGHYPVYKTIGANLDSKIN